LASAVAIAAIDVTLSENLPERSQRLGAELMKRLSSITSPHTDLKVTGKGLFCGLHFDESHSFGRVTAQRLSALVMKRGVIAVAAQNKLRVAPPLTISEEDLWKGVDIIEQALKDLLDTQEV
jgi:ornithine--oxo-acid transaminase